MCGNREDHGCKKSRTHEQNTSSKTTQMFATAIESRLACFLHFQTAKNRRQWNLRAKGCEV